MKTLKEKLRLIAEHEGVRATYQESAEVVDFFANHTPNEVCALILKLVRFAESPTRITFTE